MIPDKILLWDIDVNVVYFWDGFELIVFVSFDIIQSKSTLDKDIKGLLDGKAYFRLINFFLIPIWDYDLIWFRSIIKINT